MKTKKVEKILYEGLGFPIELYNVEMFYLNGDGIVRLMLKE